MSEEGKSVRFKFVVDEASARQVNRVFDQLISRAKELANTLKGVGGLGGGGGMGMLSGGGVGKPQSSASTLGSKVGTSNQTTSFASVLAQNVDVFKKVGQEGGAAIKVMTEALQRGMVQQHGEIGKLNNDLNGLIKLYEKAGGAAGGSFSEQIQTKILAVTKAVQKAKTELASLQKSEEQLMEKQYGPALPEAGAAAKESLFSRLTRPRSILPEGASEMMSKSALGQLMGGLGISPAMLGGAGIAAAGAWGIKNIYKQIDGAPDQYLTSDSRQATMLAQRSLELRGGEYRNKAAEQAILSDPSKREDYETLDSGWRRAKSGVGAFFRGDWDDIANGRAADQATKARRNAQIEMQRQTDPLADAILGDQQNFRATLGSMRGMGVGARHGENGYQALARHRAAYSAFDDGEISAAFQGISGSGTRNAAHRLQGGVMHATAAGIGGAAHSVGVMSKFGGGSAFSDSMRQMAGGGGIDASTVGLLTSYVAAQQDRLGLNTGAADGQYQGQGLMEMLSRGTRGPGGRLVAEQNVKGADYLQRALSGQTSPYQQARNFMIAGEAAPGINMYGQGFLASKMSLSEVADAAEGKGGDASAIFNAVGGKKQDAARYFKGVTGSLLEGVSGEAMGKTDAGIVTRAITASGMDPREFFKSGKWKGLKDQNGKAFTAESFTAGYGGALSNADGDMAPDAAMGTARDILGSGAGAKGGGGKAGSGGVAEIEMARQQMKLLADQAAKLTAEFAATERAVKSNNAMGAFEQRHKDANDPLSAQQRLQVTDFFRSHPDASGQQADEYLQDLGRRASAEAKRQTTKKQEELENKPTGHTF